MSDRHVNGDRVRVKKKREWLRRPVGRWREQHLVNKLQHVEALVHRHTTRIAQERLHPGCAEVTAAAGGGSG